MFRSISVLSLTLGGLLMGCGGMPEDGESSERQELRSPDDAAPNGEVSQSTVTTIQHPGVIVSFNSVNDLFTVRDTLQDGHSAVADILNHNTGSNTRCWNTQGVNTVESCQRDYPNFPLLSIRACTGEAGPRTLVSCGPWRDVWSLAPSPETK